ncbi:putative Glutamate carboxypeptidase [Trichostrongylus colubriformis]|uniref:Glutamate carboxypeptidase n=1 Tax=Trichostrongylus colubriformis TaxID=6319 RepID=A0AAN8ETG2_TRICO
MSFWLRDESGCFLLYSLNRGKRKVFLRFEFSLDFIATILSRISHIARISIRSLATMKVPEETFKSVFSAIDERQDEFVATLKEAVAIPSVSGDPDRRGECVNMAMWAKKKLEGLNVSVQVVEAGKQKLQDGKVIDLPPILFGVLGNDPKKKTLLVYGHLDVQPAAKEVCFMV